MSIPFITGIWPVKDIPKTPEAEAMVREIAKAIEDAVAAERERCARIADRVAWAYGGGFLADARVERICRSIAEDIRETL